jgi:hypothetical protein
MGIVQRHGIQEIEHIAFKERVGMAPQHKTPCDSVEGNLKRKSFLEWSSVTFAQVLGGESKIRNCNSLSLFDSLLYSFKPEAFIRKSVKKE